MAAKTDEENRTTGASSSVAQEWAVPGGGCIAGNKDWNYGNVFDLIKNGGGSRSLLKASLWHCPV
ncbi:MAG: hypothetical protein IPJ40_24395 [Saprospirales bacterium]|nr:hypothetical protein [Saprospirales bacterium]